MDLRKIIYELELEKQRLDEAITALERLSGVHARRKRSSGGKSAAHFAAGQEPVPAAEPALPSMPAQSVGK